MQYQGGKHIAAKHIVAAMLRHCPTDKPVIEPFCGGCSVTVALCRAGLRVQASDINQSLILLWQKALLEDLQPFELDAESYQRWKTAPDSAEKALVGYGASFGGKYFGGIARSLNRNHLEETVRTVNKQAIVLRGRAEFQCLSYLDLPKTEGTCYYLDKPYEGVTKHFGGAFDHRQFWAWVEERAASNLLFISEYSAPFGELVWERETPLGLAAGRNGEGKKQIERLYKVGK